MAAKRKRSAAALPVVEIGTIEHEGKSFSAMGSIIDTEARLIIGYPKYGNFNGIGHQLTTWHGDFIAGLAITGKARGFNGVELTCYAIDYQGRRYHGRGLGEGMAVKLRCTSNR
jgi:hypothetical protein